MECGYALQDDSCAFFQAQVPRQLQVEGDIYQVMEFQHVKPGKGQAFVRSKIKNMRTGTIKEFAFQPGLKLKLVVIEKKVNEVKSLNSK